MAARAGSTTKRWEPDPLLDEVVEDEDGVVEHGHRRPVRRRRVAGAPERVATAR